MFNRYRTRVSAWTAQRRIDGRREMKNSAAQDNTLSAIKSAIDETGGEYVSQGKIAKHMAKAPHPNVLASLVKNGRIVRNNAVSWAEYKLA